MVPQFATEEEATRGVDDTPIWSAALQKEARERMARRIDCNPNDDAQWPMELIDRLIVLERQLGKDALARELSAILRRLDPYIA